MTCPTLLPYYVLEHRLWNWSFRYSERQCVTVWRNVAAAQTTGLHPHHQKDSAGFWHDYSLFPQKPNKRCFPDTRDWTGWPARLVYPCGVARLWFGSQFFFHWRLFPVPCRAKMLTQCRGSKMAVVWGRGGFCRWERKVEKVRISEISATTICTALPPLTKGF